MMQNRWMLVAVVSLHGCGSTLMGAEPSAAVPAVQPAPAAPTPPRSADLDHTADELDRYVGCATQGYAAVGAPREITLAAFAPPEFALEAGHCYRAVVLFGPDARLSAQAQGGVHFVYRDRSKAHEVMAGPGPWGPGGVAGRGCVEQASLESLYVESTSGSAYGRAQVENLGTGTASVQLFERVIDPAQHAQCASARDACLADWRAGAPRSECEGRYNGCVDTLAGAPNPASCRR